MRGDGWMGMDERIKQLGIGKGAVRLRQSWWNDVSGECIGLIPSDVLC